MCQFVLLSLALGVMCKLRVCYDANNPTADRLLIVMVFKVPKNFF